MYIFRKGSLTVTSKSASKLVAKFSLFLLTALSCILEMNDAFDKPTNINVLFYWFKLPEMSKSQDKTIGDTSFHLSNPMVYDNSRFGAKTDLFHVGSAS